MKKRLSLILITSLSFFACKNILSHERKEINKYADSPEYIKSYLDSIHNGKFFIAEKGEEWESGCIITNKLPRAQFVQAVFDSTEYKMVFLQAGGIIGEYRDTIILVLKQNKVKGFKAGFEF